MAVSGDQPKILLIGAAHQRVRLREAVAAAGVDEAIEIGWGDTTDLAGRAPDLVVVAVDDVPPASLPDLLDALAGLAEAAPGGVVITFGQDQIDPVAAALLGRDSELLCEPDSAILAASIALALVRCWAEPPPVVRENEAERLRRLNEEVARIAEILARLTQREERRPGAVADRSSDYRGPPGTVAVAAADVRKAIRARRLRDQLFVTGLFEDPAWDMLLDLYAAELELAQVSVSSLCIAAAVPATTALRWIGRMTETGLLERTPDPFDRRRAFMVLSRAAREKMDGYFALLAQNQIAIA